MHMEIQEKSVPWYAHRGKQIILLLILLCLVLICGCSNKSSNTPIASEKGVYSCLLYTSDAADDLLCVDLGGRRIIKKTKNTIITIDNSYTYT